MKFVNFVTFVTCFLLVSASASATSVQLTLDTSPLTGTQTFGFGLTNFDSAVNDLSLSSFDFGGGSAVTGSDDCTLGGLFSGTGCSGDLSAGGRSRTRFGCVLHTAVRRRFVVVVRAQYVEQLFWRRHSGSARDVRLRRAVRDLLFRRRERGDAVAGPVRWRARDVPVCDVRCIGAGPECPGRNRNHADS